MDLPLLRELCEASGPPGAEDRVRDLVRARRADTAHRVDDLAMGGIDGVRARDGEGKECRISGTLYGHREPRIVYLNDQRVDASPEGNLILIENRDVPGVVGAVGTLLAERKVNIAQMNLGTDEEGNRALTIVKVDQNVGPHLIEELRNLDNILSVKCLVL